MLGIHTAPRDLKAGPSFYNVASVLDQDSVPDVRIAIQRLGRDPCALAYNKHVSWHGKMSRVYKGASER